MIRSRHHLLLAGLLASAFATTSFAQAPAQPVAPAAPAGMAQVQPAPPADGPRAHMHRERGQRGDPAQRMERMKAHHAERLSSLKGKLQLTTTQQAAWSKFESAQQWPARDGKQRMAREDMAKLTTPERLDRMQARQTERSARLTLRANATREFYAALSPEQQKTFDAETAMRGAGGRHGGMHERMHHGRAEAPSGAPAAPNS